MGLFSRKKKSVSSGESDYDKCVWQIADVLGNTRIKNKRTLQRVLAPYVFTVDDDWNLKDAKKERKNLASDAMYHLLALHAADEDPYKQEVDPELQQMALQDEDNWPSKSQRGRTGTPVRPLFY